MPDDLSVFLSSALHAFARIEERHGSLKAKLSPLEMLRIAAEGLHHGNQLLNAGGSHPKAAEFETLLSAPMPEAAQRLYAIAQLTTDEQQFARFCDDMADYGATISDPPKRKRLGLYLFILGRAKAEAEAAFKSAAPFAGQERPAYRGAPAQPQYVPVRQLEAPHCDEPLFGPYVSMGVKEGVARMEAAFCSFDRAMALDYFKRFRDYAASLRDSQKITVALALSNKMALLFDQRFLRSGPALASPSARNQGRTA